MTDGVSSPPPKNNPTIVPFVFSAIFFVADLGHGLVHGECHEYGCMRGYFFFEAIIVFD